MEVIPPQQRLRRHRASSGGTGWASFPPSYNRGLGRNRIRIIDEEALKAYACECYAIISETRGRIFGSSAPD